MDPLVRRAPLRAVRSGVWGLLVLAAFTLATAAAAAEPLFGSAAGDAALADQLAAVPADAVASDAPVVRLVGGTGIPGRGLLDGALDDIPGLGPGAVTAASVSVETRPLEVAALAVRERRWHPRAGTALRRRRPRPLPGPGRAPHPGERPAASGFQNRWRTGSPCVRRRDHGGTRHPLPGPIDPDHRGRQLRRRLGRSDAGGPARHAPLVLPARVGAGGQRVRCAAGLPGGHATSRRRPQLAKADRRPAALLDRGASSSRRAVAGRRPGRPSTGCTTCRSRSATPRWSAEPVGPLREQVVSGLPHLVSAAEKVAAQTRTWTTAAAARRASRSGCSRWPGSPSSARCGAPSSCGTAVTLGHPTGRCGWAGRARGAAGRRPRLAARHRAGLAGRCRGVGTVGAVSAGPSLATGSGPGGDRRRGRLPRGRGRHPRRRLAGGAAARAPPRPAVAVGARPGARRG